MAQKFIVPITVKQLASSGSDAVSVFVDADTFARLKLEAGGRLVWGDGSVAGDVNLYRDAADVLKTDDTLKVPTLFVDSIEIDTTGATSDQVLKFNGTKFAPGTGGAGGSGATISDTPPSSPTAGQVWYESDTGKTFVYYDSFWVEIVASSGLSSEQIGYLSGVTSNIQTQIDTKAPLASPTLTGTPLAPTAAVDTNTTQVATTAFVATGIAPKVHQFAYRSGAWYKPSTLNQAVTQVSTLNTTTYIPFYVSTAQTFDRIGIITGSSFAGTGSVRLGIYNNNIYAPSTVLLDAGTVATTGTSNVISITISQALSVGWYWLAMNTITAGATNSFTTASGSVYNLYNLGASNPVLNYQSGYSETVNATSGFATAVSPAGIVITMMVFLRAA